MRLPRERRRRKQDSGSHRNGCDEIIVRQAFESLIIRCAGPDRNDACAGGRGFCSQKLANCHRRYDGKRPMWIRLGAKLGDEGLRARQVPRLQIGHEPDTGSALPVNSRHIEVRQIEISEPEFSPRVVVFEPGRRKHSAKLRVGRIPQSDQTRSEFPSRNGQDSGANIAK